MKRTLSLLIKMAPLAILFISLAQAQVVVPDPNSTRVGSQLILYYDAITYDVVYLTLTNTGFTNIRLHMILYGADCIEQMDWNLIICPGGHKVYDMGRFDLGNGRTADLRKTRGFLLATPTDNSGNAPAVPYNHLAGNATHAHIGNGSAFGLNAVARPAVDAAGNRLADFAGILDGVAMMFQRIQPTKAFHDGFYALSTVNDSRIILFSFTDVYSPMFYGITGTSILLNNFATTADCHRFSLSPRTFSCLGDSTIQAYASGAWAAFLTSTGTLEISPTGYAANQNFFGISSQTLTTFATNRYLWGK